MVGSILIPWLSVKQAVTPKDAETADNVVPIEHPSTDAAVILPEFLKQSGEVSSKDSQSTDIEGDPPKDEVSTHDTQTSEVEKSSVGSTNRKVETIQH